MQKLKLYWKRFGLYILLVILPALILCIAVYTSTRDATLQKYRQDAYLTLFIDRQQIDSLISETEAKINSLSFALHPPFLKNEVEMLFDDEIQKNPILSGLNLLNQDGNTIYSTIPYDRNIYMKDEFFQIAKQTNKPVSSDPYYEKTTGKHLFSIYHPIIDENRKTIGFLLASVDMDYIKNMINSLNSDMYIRVKNSKNQTILTSGDDSFSDLNVSPVETILNKSNWKLEAYPKAVKSFALGKSLFLSFLTSFIALNIVFLFVKYLMLKRRTKTELSQIKAQKLELLSSLAASTAHEIRNPLTGIRGFIQLLKKKHQSDDDSFYFSIIENEINRINQIVTEFLVLGKPTAVQDKVHSLFDIINEILPIIHSEANLHRSDVSLEFVPNEEIHIRGSKDQIKQVILNLAKNAFESMKNGGILHIQAIKKDDHAILRITDNGEGIPKEMIQEIFQPFVSHKKNGTGLGLMVCNRIVAMHGGKIDISSELSKGTTVTVTFPAVSPG
ncbi:ATP-binding protein [Bacillus capparidis]|uniref:histidine kinase n=1 Tax=Bacillus capparidis TaxID=1840411 RepID=A0ABS4CQI6_9BACI|nr:ATP-binding protein [Bacillus capparidis]MBP1079786.1 two-component system, sporulation sensor kinase D [Bacillus capparidis]MED1095178.1 ATP-binding protein [Bacillus capparidis]